MDNGIRYKIKPEPLTDGSIVYDVILKAGTDAITVPCMGQLEANYFIHALKAAIEAYTVDTFTESRA